MRSPALRHLAEAVHSEGTGALEAFWTRVSATGTPLVEPDPEGNPAHRLVTFLWRDDPAAPAEDVLALLHTVTDKDRHAGDLSPHLMAKVPGTDVWAISHRLRADHRAAYQFSVSRGPREQALATDRASWMRVLDTALPDPLSLSPVLPARDGRHPSSVMELPDATSQPWARRHPSQARGRLTEERPDGRRVLVHLPPGHPGAAAEGSRPAVTGPPVDGPEASGPEAGGPEKGGPETAGPGAAADEPTGGHAAAADGPYPVVVLLDGEMWGPVLDFGDTLDGLLTDGRIPPAVTLMVDSMGRDRRIADLGCSEEFTDWLADGLLPWAARRYGATADPARTVIAGQSAGGLTAAFAAFRRPERFGNALCQSGSFWWPDDTEFDSGSEWLTRQYAVSERRHVRFRLEVGLQEWMLLPQNRHLRNVLEARGYDVSYEEFNGGHDYACWRGGLADGLGLLLSGREAGPAAIR
ncbi:alpha/beta hydrolase-fold protein [Streptomyces sp. NPDC002055]|uniref:alpha/beta hydrolase-fold protein n=1 Tax=Streptomyces sp. NPDC002055 TaxID=3154534 RepID=UPI00332156EB